MKCPACDVTLQLTERQGVEIDYCPQCRGVWLDRGELDKLIERAHAFEMSAPPLRGRHARAEDVAEYRDEAERYRPRRRKSFLSELFDFD
ncbi:MAG: zf-TFIIB domain-containing protein [candidate division KSB1 bacterium]|nr:zf-TFIIB domain-containing protein [candidate division KSB1 bacterium]